MLVRSHPADALGEQDLRRSLRVVAMPRELRLQDIGRNSPLRGAGPDIQTDSGRLVISQLQARGMDSAGFFERALQVAQSIQSGGNLVTGDVHFPVVAHALEQTNRLAALLDALVVSRRDIQDDAMIVQRLPLAPDVTQRFADEQRFAGIVDSPSEPGNQAHRRRMFRIRLGQLERGGVPLGKIHAPHVRPKYVSFSVNEPIAMRQPAEDAETQQFDVGRWFLAARDEQPGQQRVQSLNRGLPDKQQQDHERAAGDVPAQLPQRLFERLGRRLHFSAFECQLAEFERDSSAGQLSVGEPGCPLEQHGRPGIVTTQHFDFAVPGGNAVPDVAIGLAGAPFCDFVLLFGDLQRVLCSGLFGRSQSKRQGPCLFASGVKVVGQVEHTVGRLLLQIRRGAGVQVATLISGQTLEQRLANAVVDENAVRRRGIEPHEVPLPRLVEGRHELRRRLVHERRRNLQLELFAQHGADPEHFNRMRMQQLDAPQQKGGGRIRRLQVVEFQGLDAPAVCSGHKCRGFDKPVQHR